jgi:hypothetical protein
MSWRGLGSRAIGGNMDEVKPKEFLKWLGYYCSEYNPLADEFWSCWQAAYREGWEAARRMGIDACRDMAKGGSQYRVSLGEACDQIAKDLEKIEPEERKGVMPE